MEKIKSKTKYYWCFKLLTTPKKKQFLYKKLWFFTLIPVLTFPTPDILPLLCSLLPVFCNYLSFYHLTIIVSTWQYCVALKLLLDVLSLNLPSCELKKIFVFIQIVTVPFPFSPAQSTSSDDGLFLKRAVWGPGLWRADRWTAEN